MTKLLQKLDAINDLDKKLSQIDPALTQTERTGTLTCLLANFGGNTRAINVYMTAALADVERKRRESSTTK